MVYHASPAEVLVGDDVFQGDVIETGSKVEATPESLLWLIGECPLTAR